MRATQSNTGFDFRCGPQNMLNIAKKISQKSRASRKVWFSWGTGHIYKSTGV